MHLAEDVPERDVDAADRRAADDAVAVPEVLAVHHLPEVLDPRRVFADDQLGEILDRADDRARVPLERRLAPAEQAGLVGDDLDEDPVAHPRVADVRLDRGDLHAALRTLPEQRDALVDQRRHPAAADVRVRDPVGPAVAVLVEDVVERDARRRGRGRRRARSSRRSRSCSRARASARTGCAERISAPGPLKSSNGFATIAASPIASACSSASIGTSARADHVRVEREHRATGTSAGYCCAEVAVWTVSSHASGKSGFGSASSAASRASMSSSAYAWRRRGSSIRVEAAASVGVAGGLDPAEHLDHGGADRLARARPGARTSGATPPSSRTSSPTPRRRRRSRRGRAPRRRDARARPPRAAGRGSRRSRAASGRPSASGGRRSSRRPRAASRRRGRRRSPRRSRRPAAPRLTRLTVIPGARPAPKPTRAGVSERQAA